MQEPRSDNWTVWLEAQRHRAVDMTLLLVLVTGLFGLVVSVSNAISTGSVPPNLPYYGTAYVAILTILLARRLADRLRARLFLIVMYGFSVFSLAAGWLVSGGRVFLLASIVVAAILAGPATSVVVILVSILTYVGFGLAYHQGWLNLGELPDPTSVEPILIEGAGFVMAVGMVAASQWFFGRALRAASIANQQAEEARRLASDSSRLLEAANQELEAFCYSVSHDLREPLRAIHGFSQVLEEDAGPGLGEADKAHLAKIRGAATRMSGLIDGLLRLSKLNRAEMRARRVDLTEIVKSLEAELRSRPRQGEVEVTIEPGLQVDGDPDLLHAALGNLLENAFKFTAGETCAHIEVGSLLSDDGVTIFVRDDGAGFDPEHADKLFSPFQRLHHEQDFPGIGVGLATVARIIKRHGGRIWATAEVGKGATFFFTLPHIETH